MKTLAIGALIALFSQPAHAGDWNTIPKHSIDGDYPSGVRFQWQYQNEKSAVRIKLTNRTDDKLTVEYYAVWSNGKKKRTGAYGVKPGKYSIEVVCAGAASDACEWAGNPSIKIKEWRKSY